MKISNDKDRQELTLKLLGEYMDLHVKVEKLEKAIKHFDKSETADACFNTIYLLEKQLSAMKEYENVLFERIEEINEL